MSNVQRYSGFDAGFDALDYFFVKCSNTGTSLLTISPVTGVVRIAVGVIIIALSFFAGLFAGCKNLSFHVFVEGFSGSQDFGFFQIESGLIDMVIGGGEGRENWRGRRSLLAIEKSLAAQED